MAIKSFSEGVDQLNMTIPRLIGSIAWAMLTFEKDSAEPWKLHVRNSQPCYGEMRKYKISHSDCTQPLDTRPGDLHHPFPEGTPMAIGVKWGVLTSVSKEIAKNIFNPITSPWKRGFKKPELLIEGDILHGISFYDTAFDPTVFVHALKFFWQVANHHEDYRTFRECGLDVFDACIATNVISGYRPTRNFNPYYTAGSFTPRFSVKRYKDKNPLDLTGGTLRQRFDYNRKQLNSIFYEEDGIDLHRSIVQRIGRTNQIIPPDVIGGAIKEVLTCN